VSTIPAITERVKKRSRRSRAPARMTRPTGRRRGRGLFLLGVAALVIVGVSVTVGWLQSSPAAIADYGRRRRGDPRRRRRDGWRRRTDRPGPGLPRTLRCRQLLGVLPERQRPGRRQRPQLSPPPRCFRRRAVVSYASSSLRDSVSPSVNPLALLDDRGSAAAAIAQARNDVHTATRRADAEADERSAEGHSRDARGARCRPRWRTCLLVYGLPGWFRAHARRM
jgi:hypothetical protein